MNNKIMELGLFPSLQDRQWKLLFQEYPHLNGKEEFKRFCNVLFNEYHLTPVSSGLSFHIPAEGYSTLSANRAYQKEPYSAKYQLVPSMFMQKMIQYLSYPETIKIPSEFENCYTVTSLDEIEAEFNFLCERLEEEAEEQKHD